MYEKTMITLILPALIHRRLNDHTSCLLNSTPIKTAMHDALHGLSITWKTPQPAHTSGREWGGGSQEFLHLTRVISTEDAYCLFQSAFTVFQPLLVTPHFFFPLSKRLSPQSRDFKVNNLIFKLQSCHVTWTKPIGAQPSLQRECPILLRLL